VNDLANSHKCEKCDRDFHNNWIRWTRGKMWVMCPEEGGCGHKQSVDTIDESTLERTKYSLLSASALGQINEKFN